MPGPASLATTSIPSRPRRCTTRSAISPLPAYAVMFRATSEIAVASSVRSVLEKPRSEPIARASCRAKTTSASDSIGTRTLSPTATRLPADLLLQEREPLLEVERRVDVLEVHAQLDHRERDLRLDADDDGLRAAQPGHVRDAAQRARHERVHHVERGDVDHDPARPVAADLAHDVVLQPQDVRVGERRLDRGDEERALLEDRDGHVRPS